MLSKMGWKEGTGLGRTRSGRAEPIEVGARGDGKTGIGARDPKEVTAEDDDVTKFKKRMMLAYKFRASQ